jgi:PAS domain S-box-containing protein
MADMDSPVAIVVLVCGVAFFCYEADKLAYMLGIPPDNVASFWPSTALLVAVLLLVPRKLWPLVVAAGLGAMALADFGNGVRIQFEAWLTFSNLAETLVAAFGIRHLLKGELHLSNLKILAKYIVFAVILVPFASAFVGAKGSLLEYGLEWRIWFFADALAFLTVTPAILSWVRDGRAWARKSRNYVEFAALMALLILLGYITFVRTREWDRPALLYSLVPLLLWAALRLGVKGVSTSMIVIALLSIWGAAHARGPFYGQGPLDNTLSLQLFLFFAAIPFTVLAVLVEQQQRVQQELIEEDAQLIEAQRLAQLGSWHWEPSTDTVTWSRELYRMCGLDPDLPAPSFKEHPQMYTPESMERLQHVVQDALIDGTAYELDLEMVCYDGATIWIRARGEAQRDVAGHIVALRGTAQDITERKRVEATLRDSEERLRLAAQAGKMYAFDWDVASDTIIRSEEAMSIPGLTDEPVRLNKQQLLDRVHPEDRATFSDSIAKLTPTEPNTQIRFRLLSADGTEVWLERSGRAYFDEQGRMVRMIGMVADITERKRAEEALATIGGRLIAAHEEERAWIARELHDDIGQQLALLANYLDLMEKDPPDTGESIRSRVNEQLKRVREISADVQAMSHRLHSSKLRYLGIVSAAKSFCQEISKQHKVEVHFTHAGIPPTVPDEISLCLFRVVQEALHNAVKHSGVQQFEVELLGTPDVIHLMIRDSGVGIDSATVTTNQGLGLVSMQERVNLLKGTFSIDSRPEHGTTIQVRLPLRVSGESARAAGG